MQLKRAERKRVKLKVGLAGPAGSGKTYSALLLAKGLVGDWEKVAVIDTENGSADLYSDLGHYNTLTMRPPFSPDKFLTALDKCVEGGMEVVVIDSVSHEWMGEGGILDYQAKLGGKFQDWAKATPLHRQFIDGILQAPVHVILCARVKTEWALEQNDRGKVVPQKVGLKLEQRDGLEYDLTVSWRISQAHLANTDKDRTGLFVGKADFKITEETGKRLVAWANSGAEPAPFVATTVDPDDDDYYIARDWQKPMLLEAAKAAGVTTGEQLKALSKHCVEKHVPMEELGRAVREHVANTWGPTP